MTKEEVAPEPVPDPQLASEQLPSHKVRVKKLHQRSCNLKDEKNKMCGGHLKRGLNGDLMTGEHDATVPTWCAAPAGP